MTPVTEAFAAFLNADVPAIEQEGRRKLVKALCALSGVEKLIDAPADDHAPLLAIHGYLTGKRVGPIADPVEGYEPLAYVLSLAYDQSARGKGKERHATPTLDPSTSSRSWRSAECSVRPLTASFIR